MAQQNGLSYFQHKFTQLRVNCSGKLVAPHKPVLMLSVLDLAGRGNIVDGIVRPNLELLAAFQNRWRQLVHTPHRCTMALPYWHLRSEGFWQLVSWPRQNEVMQNFAHSPSLAALERMVSHAQIDPDLWTGRHRGL